MTVDVPSTARTLWVKKEGDASWAEVTVDSTMSVARMTKEIVKKLPRLRDKDLSTLILYVAKDPEGRGLGEALDSTDSVEEALPKTGKIRIVIKAAGASEDSILHTDADIKDVMAGLGRKTRQRVAAAADHRAVVSKLKILQELHVGMSAAAARAAGVNVLREDAKGVMTAGTFTLPRLDLSILHPPKTFDQVVSEDNTTFLLLPQRIERAMELVDAVLAGRPLAAHLSGPSGVGKSAVLLLAYLVCVARGIPVAFIARTTEWLHALQNDSSCGDAFLLETVWRQNADLIVGSPPLRAVFVDKLMNEERPFGADVMQKLRRTVASVLHKRHANVPGIAVLLDEVQNITKAAVHAAQAPSPKDALAGAGRYFANTWYTWHKQNGNIVFPRLSAASAHSLRDSTLPAGEQHRLRIMEPLDDADRDALQTSPQSPAYIKDEKARQRAVLAAGNILRNLVTAAQLLPAKGAIYKPHLDAMWNEMWSPMVAECQLWIESLASDERRKVAADGVMSLLRGEQQWECALALYDAGIVYRSADATTSVVRPVSIMAHAVLLHVTSAFQRTHRKHLSDFTEPSIKGCQFEMQVLTSLDPFQGMLQCKRLNGDDADALLLHSTYSLPFDKLEEVEPRDAPVLYRPFERGFACDGIIMHADGDVQPRIYVIECSVTDPCTTDRPDKVAKWFKPDGIVSKLQGMFPMAGITILLCFPDHLPPRKGALPQDAAALSAHDPLLPLSSVATATPDGSAFQGHTAAPAANASAAPAFPAPVYPSGPIAAVAGARRSVEIRVVDLHSLRTFLNVLA